MNIKSPPQCGDALQKKPKYSAERPALLNPKENLP